MREKAEEIWQNEVGSEREVIMFELFQNSTCFRGIEITALKLNG